MLTIRTLSGIVAAAALLISCGGIGDSGDSSTASTLATPTTTEMATTTAVVGLPQPAIWPAADVVFATPEEAAADFVTQVLGVGPVLGEFVGGDSRSGEIEVFSPGEGGATIVTSPDSGAARGLLLLRQLGPDDGWFILAAVNDFESITSPESTAVVPAGPLTVEGVGRGQEGNVIVTAYVAGDAEVVLDSQFTMAGALETAEPFSVTLDLSGAEPGDIVMLLVRGGTGLETDPGEFSAVPVVIATP